MKDTLLYILKHIVTYPDEITVEEKQIDDRTILVIHAHSEDIGKIIGKKGRIIMALRDLVKLMATKENVFADVEVAEAEQSTNDKSTNLPIND